MTNTLDDLDYLVLQAVADDFEEFEMIVNEITKWTSNNARAPDVDQIQQALMRAIADELVKAYEHREDLGQLVATEADPQRMRNLWFYITQQGKIRMQKLEEEAERT